MIVNCPHCRAQSRREPGLNLAGARLECHSCGHSWKDAEVRKSKQNPDTTQISKVYEVSQQVDAEYLLNATKQLRSSYIEKAKLKQRHLFAWACLASVTLLPLGVAAAMPEQTVTALPKTIEIYERLNWPVNLYGLEIQNVEQQNRIVDGQHVLMVKGEIANISNNVQRVPALNFRLLDQNGREVQAWVQQDAKRPLQSGEVTSFTTRLTAPAYTAQDLQIRFAHRDEIGSNAGL